MGLAKLNRSELLGLAAWCSYREKDLCSTMVVPSAHRVSSFAVNHEEKCQMSLSRQNSTKQQKLVRGQEINIYMGHLVWPGYELAASHSLDCQLPQFKSWLCNLIVA